MLYLSNNRLLLKLSPSSVRPLRLTNVRSGQSGAASKACGEQGLGRVESRALERVKRVVRANGGKRTPLYSPSQLASLLPSLRQPVLRSSKSEVEGFGGQAKVTTIKPRSFRANECESRNRGERVQKKSNILYVLGCYFFCTNSFFSRVNSCFG